MWKYGFEHIGTQRHRERSLKSVFFSGKRDGGKRYGGKNDRMSLTGRRCGSLWDFVGLSIPTRREYWLVINRDGSFQFVKGTYLNDSKSIPEKTPFSFFTEWTPSPGTFRR